ncbi:hypothetical protein CK203_062669 [Vitis vinifera]|uniref:Integrase catalytic domain-containing protein n=1 Tax=Vitis vinifera TaxID=29760 RepID=A0A438FRX4_VITVI|nr:hypothetical protein CK203_062669 [Vitis vinifera]
MGLMKVLFDMYEKPFANNKPMRAIVSNFLGNAKLKFNDIRDQILVEEVRRIDSSEALIASSTLNLENKGASFHITAHEEIMENYVFRNYGKVYLEDGTPLDIIGVGDIYMKISNGSMWKIHKCKAMVENETNLRVKCLKSDNGEEYIDDDFKQYCPKNGIKMIKTIPGKPQ